MRVRVMRLKVFSHDSIYIPSLPERQTIIIYIIICWGVLSRVDELSSTGGHDRGSGILSMVGEIKVGYEKYRTPVV